MQATSTRALRACAIVVLLTGNAVFAVGPAFSGSLARVVAQGTASTGTWAEVVRTVGTSTATGIVGVTQILAANANPVYSSTLELANVGTLDLTSTSIAVTITRTAGNGNPIVTGTYIGCRNGTWSAAATPACSGTQVTLGTASGAVGSTTTFTPSVALTANTALPIRLAMTANRAGTFVFSASVTISRSRARTAIVTQS